MVVRGGSGPLNVAYANRPASEPCARPSFVALGCVVAGVWLLVVGIVYTGWLAVAISLVAAMFGVCQLRRPTCPSASWQVVEVLLERAQSSGTVYDELRIALHKSGAESGRTGTPKAEEVGGLGSVGAPPTDLGSSIMTARSEDLPISAAGLMRGHRAFQEFLLAGERHVNSEFERPGAERRFAAFYGALPAHVRNNVAGYFRRQSTLDLSQRAALLGPFLKLDISTPLNRTTTRSLPAPNKSVRSELDSLNSFNFASPTSKFTVVPSIIKAQAADAAQGQQVAPVRAEASVRHIDLLLQEVTVEKSNDDTLLTKATDTVHLAVTTVSETGQVEAVLSKFGSRDEGPVYKFKNDVLATIDIDTTNTQYPRTFTGSSRWRVRAGVL